MQLWRSHIRRLNSVQISPVHSLILPAGLTQTSPSGYVLRNSRCSIAISTNNQAFACGACPTTNRPETEDYRGRSHAVPRGLEPQLTNLDTALALQPVLDVVKPRRPMGQSWPPGYPMDSHQQSLTWLTQQTEETPEQNPSTAHRVGPTNLNHLGTTFLPTHASQWDVLTGQGLFSSNQKHISLPSNAMPHLPQWDHWSPPRMQRRTAATKALSTELTEASTIRPSTKPSGPRGRDPITSPSAESGGIPEPSPAYLLRASFLPRTLTQPRPMLVIIDLNGTLLHRPRRDAPLRFVARPHARAFLTYCIDTFHVVIWSSAREQNVDGMCDNLLSPAQRARVLAVWGRDRFGLSPADYKRRVQCYKRLTRVWADPAVAAAHPLGAAWDQGNTVLIDDSAEKARSEPFNAVQIPEFKGGNNKGGDASILPQVHDYLNTLACQQDISAYIRVHPFKASSANSDA